MSDVYPEGSKELQRILHQRHYAPRSVSVRRKTDLEVLKERHRFIREERRSGNEPLSWEDQLAEKWYSKLYREFALIDLKHYKSGGIAMRWRTEAEVLDCKGERTCANLRCEWHEPLDEDDSELRRWRRKRDRSESNLRSERNASRQDTSRGKERARDFNHRASFVRLEDVEEAHEEEGPMVPQELTPYQLNFAYEEAGEMKNALVKVVLCKRCSKKLNSGREAASAARQLADAG